MAENPISLQLAKVLMMSQLGLAQTSVHLDSSVPGPVPNTALTVSGANVAEDLFMGTGHTPEKVTGDERRTFSFKNTIGEDGETWMTKLGNWVKNPSTAPGFDERFSKDDIHFLQMAQMLLPRTEDSKDKEGNKEIKELINIFSSKKNIDFKDYEGVMLQIENGLKSSGIAVTPEVHDALAMATKIKTDGALINESTKKLDGIELDEKTKAITRINNDEFIFIRAASAGLQKDDGVFSKEDAEKIKSMADELLKTGIEFKRGDKNFDIGKLSKQTGISEDILEKASKVDDMSRN